MDAYQVLSFLQDPAEQVVQLELIPLEHYVLLVKSLVKLVMCFPRVVSVVLQDTS